MFSGRAGLVERLGWGPQGTELGCLPLTLIPGPEGVEGSIFKSTNLSLGHYHLLQMTTATPILMLSSLNP